MRTTTCTSRRGLAWEPAPVGLGHERVGLEFIEDRAERGSPDAATRAQIADVQWVIHVGENLQDAVATRWRTCRDRIHRLGRLLRSHEGNGRGCGL
ncbi:MAG: hypothetical protein KAY24_15235 [Candidatus Eisenbacteria sp.]|nr:hypothetical protein [Candidatus Eisenbacteria bacterium]